MGIHADLLDPADIVMMAKWLVVAEILYAFNLGWTKISLLMMYYRIFHVPYFKKMAWAVGTFVMIWVVTITFIFIFICVPVAKMYVNEGYNPTSRSRFRLRTGLSATERVAQSLKLDHELI
jgi:hypothetical protein